MHFTSSCRQ